MSRRKAVHVPKVWEVEEISDDDDEQLEEMQKEVEDILTKITSKKKTSYASEVKTPLHFDIKVEVEECDVEPIEPGPSNQQHGRPATSNQQTAKSIYQNTQKLPQVQNTMQKTTWIQPKQSILMQPSKPVPNIPNIQEVETVQSKSPQIMGKRNFYFPIKQCGKQFKVSNPTLYQQFELDSQAIKADVRSLRDSGNKADALIYMLMTNNENNPTTPAKSKLENALQKALGVWSNWFIKDPVNRGAPLLYKCRDCGWAWWHLHPFRVHLLNTHPLTTKTQQMRLKFDFEATHGEAYIGMKISLRPQPPVRIVNAPCWRCGLLPEAKYKNYDTTTCSYNCACGACFITCYEYRLHIDYCEIRSAKPSVAYKCTICFLRYNSAHELLQHRQLSHTVRSDVPAACLANGNCTRCHTPHYNAMHECSAIKRTVPCAYCTRKFSNKTIAKLHQSFSRENYQCRLCDRVLDRQCMELMHLVEHTDNYVLLSKCTMCDDVYFYNDSAYNIHLLAKHPLADQPATKLPVPVKCLNISDSQQQEDLATDCGTWIDNTIIGAKSRKRKRDGKEYPPKRLRTIININDKNWTNVATSDVKVEDQSIEEFINTENEINEMILKNKDNTVVKIKLENLDDIVIEENELNISNNENCNQSNAECSININEAGNTVKVGTCLPNVNESKDCDNTVKIKLENSEQDNVESRENDLNIAITNIASNLDFNKDNSTTSESSRIENSVNTELCCPRNNDEQMKRNENGKLQASTNRILSGKQNQDLEIRKEDAKSLPGDKEMVDYELHIEKCEISSSVKCNETNQGVINTDINCKIDDKSNNKINTCNKLNDTLNGHKENSRISNALKEETQNTEMEKIVPNDKDSHVQLKENECYVNQKELNINTNKTNPKKVTIEVVLENKEIISSEEMDSHDKEIAKKTSIVQSVPDKENRNSEQIDNSEHSKTIKVEQKEIKGIDGNIKIKEEILDDDTDDEKLVIAEFTNLITDKSVKLEVKEEPAECLGDNLLSWSPSNDADDNEVDVGTENRNDSSSCPIWTPTLGVVRDGPVEEENRDSDDDDLPLLHLKKKKAKQKLYSCKRCKFKGTHRQYYYHRMSGVHKKNKSNIIPQGKKTRSRFYPEDYDCYKCSTCAREFVCLNEYLLHLPLHRYKQDQCPECLEIFPTWPRLTAHVAYHINKSYVALRGLMSVADSKFTMQCFKCSSEVKAEDFFSHWEKHIVMQRPERSDSAISMKFAPENPVLRDLIALLLGKRSAEEEGTRLRWCKMCRRRFTRENECKRHFIEHMLDDAFARVSDSRALRCQICGEKWHTAGEFRLHIRRHAAMPIYRCELCAKCFSDSSNFAKHRKVHNLCAYTCDTCGKKFNRKRTLVDHLELHKKYEPISCSVEGCSRQFYSQALYKRHHKNTHQRAQFTCNICKVKMDSLKKIWDHKWKVHKIRKLIADCPLCDKQFRKYADVKHHMREEHADQLPETRDLKKLNDLSPAEKSSNVAQLRHDVVVILEPKPEPVVIDD